jgi:uncharacterized protein (TIGR03435 family)
MTQRFACTVRFGRRLLLTLIGLAAVVAPIVFGLANSPQVHAQSAQTTGVQAQPASDAPLPSFEVASIKPSNSQNQRVGYMFDPGGRFVAHSEPVRNLITTVYQPRAGQMVADAKWDRLLSESFDVETSAKGNPPIEQMRLMLRSLLRDRFKLTVHWETRQLPIYALVLSKPGQTGPQLILNSDTANCIDPTRGVASPLPGPGETPSYCGMFSISRKSEGLTGTGTKVPMDKLVAWLGGYLDRPLFDDTGLKGDFDVKLEFASQQGPDALHPPPPPIAAEPAPSAFPAISTAIREQLGLRLEAKSGSVDVLVIDHVERPSEN